ncbi:MAG: peptide chain release factor N(5)-glutamine methyltransferase [Verrucomicrobia bacterium]|nr:peptide chain release factor N(5)-glutamine methyltransferase [Verrucomicrobiota bacterium]
MLTVLEIIKRTTDFLAGKGVANARLNAELLVGHALGRKRMQLYLEFERPLVESELERIRPLVRRRAQHEPVQYITGATEFAGVKLKVDRRALIPRPETELLVETVAEWCAGHPPVQRVLDLGTGSGAIAVALGRSLPDAEVTATDRSPSALDLARENVVASGLASRVSVLEADWFAGVPGGVFDVIVSNPPYLSEAEAAQTAPEVREFEPWTALAAPKEGLAELERIIAGAPAHLRKGGLLALETGIDQHAQLAGWLRTGGFASVESRKDLTGRDRFILAVW